MESIDQIIQYIGYKPYSKGFKIKDKTSKGYGFFNIYIRDKTNYIPAISKKREIIELEPEFIALYYFNKKKYESSGIPLALAKGPFENGNMKQKLEELAIKQFVKRRPSRIKDLIQSKMPRLYEIGKERREKKSEVSEIDEWKFDKYVKKYINEARNKINSAKEDIQKYLDKMMKKIEKKDIAKATELLSKQFYVTPDNKLEASVSTVFEFGHIQNLTKVHHKQYVSIKNILYNILEDAGLMLPKK